MNIKELRKKIPPKKCRKIFIIALLCGGAIGILGASLSEEGNPVLITIGMIVMIASMAFYLVFYHCPYCGYYLGRMKGTQCPHCHHVIDIKPLVK